ncbi:phosphoglycolate phosphatase 2 [Drosophila serrata]|uniref:phosphoglycolate phosphatase 2 n=1 Tax=Drosophila serrata TaxID=7274 RepID=UPI000A1D02A6|nr:phosphoglycolate phosphatase 2 [Drosophila serrata]
MFKRSCSLLDKLSKQQVAEWLGGIQTVIFGTDGVLWHEYEPIEGSVDVFNAVRAKGKRCLIVTNDSILTNANLTQKAAGMGYQVREQDVLNSAGSISSYLIDRKFEKKVLVMGGSGICRDLRNAGFCTIVSNQNAEGKCWVEFVSTLELDPDVGAVVVARDDAMDTNGMIVACNYLQNPKVLFLTTGRDGSIAFGKQRIPDAATVAAAIQVIVNRKPVVLGKPHPRIMGKLLESGEIEPEKTLVIGNSLKEDMAFASICGFQSLLVADEKALKEAQRIKEEGNENKIKLVPDLYLSSLAHFMSF